MCLCSAVPLAAHRELKVRQSAMQGSASLHALCSGVGECLRTHTQSGGTMTPASAAPHGMGLLVQAIGHVTSGHIEAGQP